MPTITTLRPSRRRPSAVDVYLDGVLVGSVPEVLVARYGLEPGSAVDSATAEALRQSGRFAAALTAANTLLAHRPRSVSEVQGRLRAQGFDQELITDVVAELERQGLLNDQRFAALWIESRQSFSPRSSRMLTAELRRKGVDRDDIEHVLSNSDPDEAAQAVAAGRQRLRAFSSLDQDGFRKRMGGYLARRGFSYEITERAVGHLWAESHGDNSE